MQEVTLTIRNKVGLHARPAARFVQTANRFKAQVVAVRDEREANAKSILSVLSLGANQGAVVTVRADGEDEAQAIEAIRLLVEDNFGEE
jgi:phosphocarrier protein HPr